MLQAILLFLRNQFKTFLGQLGIIYALYLSYVAINYRSFPDKASDPIFRLTNITRYEQIFGVSITFGIAAMAFLIWRLMRADTRLNVSSNTAVMRGTILLVVLIFLNCFVASLSAVINELSSQFWVPLFAWVSLVLSLEALIVYITLSRSQQWWFPLPLMAALSLFNLYALYLSLMGKFLIQPAFIRAAFMIFAFLCLWIIFLSVSKRIVLLRRVNTVLVLTFIAPLAGIALPSSTVPESTNPMTYLDEITFRTRPNIHIVSFDGLAPIALTKKYMGLSDLPYAKVLDRDGVLTFKNAFASKAPTKASLNSLMRLANTDVGSNSGYFAGRKDGPVSNILHANGYTISTGFNNLYFGTKGPFVDSYQPTEVEVGAGRHSTLCALATKNPLKFFGFCDVASLTESAGPVEIWPNTVIDAVQRATPTPRAKPVFTLHYIGNPIGHVKSNYRSSDREALARFSESYRRKSAEVAKIMEHLRKLVSENSRPSILLVIGDHGPYLSQTISFYDDPAFVVQDQHGILATVLVNKTGCTAEQLQHYTPTYATPARILAGVMRCLSHDPVRFDLAMKFVEKYKFENFLYESKP